jgi:hypothetical protein
MRWRSRVKAAGEVGRRLEAVAEVVRILAAAEEVGRVSAAAEVDRILAVEEGGRVSAAGEDRISRRLRPAWQRLPPISRRRGPRPMSALRVFPAHGLALRKAPVDRARMLPRRAEAGRAWPRRAEPRHALPARVPPDRVLLRPKAPGALPAAAPKLLGPSGPPARLSLASPAGRRPQRLKTVVCKRNPTGAVPPPRRPV